MIDAMEFTRKGDEVWNRLADRFPSAHKRRLLIEERLGADAFQRIRAAAARYISTSLGLAETLEEPELMERLLQERGNIPNYRSDGLLVPKREHVFEFNLLHRAVADAFRGFHLEPVIDTIDLPINMRMVYGKANKGSGALPFSSTKPHSDVWAGVPADAVVVVMPIFGDIENITIACGEMDRALEYEAMRGMSDYLDGRQYKVVEPYSDAAMKLGHLYMADARLIHQTVRHRTSGVRVSLDFRFRHNAPEYRAMCPKVDGPEAMDQRVPYARWLDVGSDLAVLFDESVHDRPGPGAPCVTGAPFGYDYRLVDLFPRAMAAK